MRLKIKKKHKKQINESICKNLSEYIKIEKIELDSFVGVKNKTILRIKGQYMLISVLINYN